MKLGKDISQEELNDIVDIIDREDPHRHGILEPSIKDLWGPLIGNDEYSRRAGRRWSPGYIFGFESKPRITKQKKYMHYTLIGYYIYGAYKIYLVKNKYLERFKETHIL